MVVDLHLYMYMRLMIRKSCVRYDELIHFDGCSLHFNSGRKGRGALVVLTIKCGETCLEFPLTISCGAGKMRSSEHWGSNHRCRMPRPKLFGLLQ